ncbi:MAG: Lrp/AsnC family transcriptional regulator [Desulfurococcales archaeon]|nr:Lrp/AsnC family transcriptional regulator [Desulfurococcales archaeon]
MLERDSRTPWARIARALGVSEATVYLRVRKLQEQGILEGFTIRVNPRRMGFPSTVFLMVKVKAGFKREFAERAKNLPYVVEVHEITGDYHFMVKALAPGSEEAIGGLIDMVTEMEGVEDVIVLYSIRTVLREAGIVSKLLKSRHEGGQARASGHK